MLQRETNLPSFMIRSLSVFVLVIAVSLMTGGLVHGEEPLEVLYVTGGGWHDYETQKGIVPPGLEERANVSVTVEYISGGKQAPKKHPAYKGDNWSKGYDLVIHNICNSSDMNNPDWVKHITQPHVEGLPAVFIHCSMHCFTPDESRKWQKLIGVNSANHEKHHPITITNKKSDHPIMKNFPETWTTPKGELYRIKDLFSNTVPLAEGQASEGKKHTCIWTNTFGEARVFGTTIGHHNETVRTDTFLDLVTRGVLWAAGHLNDDGSPENGYGPEN